MSEIGYRHVQRSFARGTQPERAPLRAFRVLVDGVLHKRSRPFDTLYSYTGRSSIAPEQLLRPLRLEGLYTIRRERLLMAQLDYNLLFRWFVGLNMDDAVWDPTGFSKNRERLLAGAVAQTFFDLRLAQAHERELRSDDHFTVDGTLIEAWAGQKSLKRKGSAPPSPPDDPGNPSLDCRGERRTNGMLASITDPEAHLYKKAITHEGKRSYWGDGLTENRHSLVVDTRVVQATGAAECEAALAMAEAFPGQPRVTRYVAQHTAGRSSAIDRHTTRHLGDTIRQRTRPCVEEIFRVTRNDGVAAADAASRGRPGGLDVHLCGHRVQLGPHADPGGGHISERWNRYADVPSAQLAVPPCGGVHDLLPRTCDRIRVQCFGYRISD
jgi:transposase